MNGHRSLFLLIAIGFSILTSGCQTSKVTRATAVLHSEQMSRDQATALVKETSADMYKIRGHSGLAYPYVIGVNDSGLIVASDHWKLLEGVFASMTRSALDKLAKTSNVPEVTMPFDTVLEIEKRRGGYIDIYSRNQSKKVMFYCGKNTDQLVIALYTLCPNLQ